MRFRLTLLVASLLAIGLWTGAAFAGGSQNNQGCDKNCDSQGSQGKSQGNQGQDQQ